MNRFFRLSLRLRLMIIGVAGLAAALAIGGIALYVVLDMAVNNTLDHEARTTATEVAALIDRGVAPNPLPISGAQVVQVIDAKHRVIDGSVNADRLTPLLHPDELAQALSGTPVTVAGNRAALSGPLRVSAITAGPGGARVSVVVALQVADVMRSVDVLRVTLLITSPILLAVLAVIAWFVIGRTLRPVEVLRQGAERISGSGRTERLPVGESADEIRALAVTLNGMLDRLTAARSRQRAFVADAAHELRSPLTNMRIQLEVAQRLGEGGTLPADLLTDVDRLAGLVEDLLMLAKVDEDTRGPAAPTTFDAHVLLAEVVRTRHERGAGAHLTLEPGNPIPVTADRDEMGRAVGNLVDNALRHATSEVVVSAEETPEEVTLSIADDGPGIAAADRERVFERFTRLDDSRGRDAGGSGLGLSIVRELVRRAGGTVTLSDPVNSTERSRIGLTASIHLPRQRDVTCSAPTGRPHGPVDDGGR